MRVALVPLPAPYDFHLSVARFRAYGLDLASLWDAEEQALWRVVQGRAVRVTAAAGAAGPGGAERGLAAPSQVVGGGAGDGGRRAGARGAGAGVEVSPGGPAVEREVARLLGAPFDLGGLASFVAAAGDPVLARLHARFAGFRPPLATTPFEALVTAITAQQVSLASALAVRNRLVAAYGEAPGLEEPAAAGAAVAPAARRVRAFPRAERVAALDPAALVPLGFSRRKAEYVVGVARAAPLLDSLAALPDDEVKARLVALRGLGEWTADWYLARYLARPEAWPAGDLVLRRACSLHYADGRDLLAAEVRSLGARFAPFQNLVAHLLLLGSTLP